MSFSDLLALFESVLVPLLIVFGVLAGMGLLLQLIGAGLYDYRRALQARERSLYPNAQRYRVRPLVSVVVVVLPGQAAGLLDCLDSITSSRYRKYEIVVVDMSGEALAQDAISIVREERPGLGLRSVTKRKVVSVAAAGQDALRRHAKGELAMVVPADMRLQAGSLQLAVQQLQNDESIEVVVPQLQRGELSSWGDLMGRYEGLLAQRGLKARSALRYLHRVPLQGVVAERRLLSGLLRAADKQSRRQLVFSEVRAGYAQEMIIENLSDLTLRQWLQARRQAQINSLHDRLRLQIVGGTSFLARLAWTLVLIGSIVVAVLAPVLLAYALYVAVALHQASYLLVIFGLITALLLSAIWDDRQASVATRLRYVAGVPLSYAFSCLLAVLVLVSTLTAPLFWRRQRLA